MTGKLADLSEEDRALLTDEEIAAWGEIDEEEQRDETDEEREAREQEEADQLAAEQAAQAEAERVRLEAEQKAAAKNKPEPDPKKPAAKEPEKTPEKTPEELEAEAAAAAEAEAQAETVARKPRPLFKAEVPADLAEQRTALDTKEDDLAAKFDEGELTTKEFNQQIRAINRERNALDKIELKAELVAESTQSRSEESWDDVTAAFFDEHPDILKSTGKLAALNQFVMQETAKTMDKGQTAGRADLDRAYKLYCADMGIEPAAAEQKPAGRKPPTVPKNVPPTLRNVPAAETADTDDGKFAYLDNLNGEDFERALEKLTPSEQAAYYAS